MGFDAASFFDFVRAARTRVARYVGISGLGTNPTNPWCQPRAAPRSIMSRSQKQLQRTVQCGRGLTVSSVDFR